PKVIWEKLRFVRPDGRNIVCGSFYDERETVLRDGAFDLVIGNPPFKRIDEDAHATDIPCREMAYSVLKESFAFVREGGRVCLIQPSGILYNSSCREFAQRFFTRQTLETVFDFVSINQLFNANVTTVALLCKKAQPEAWHETRHLIFRRTVAVQKRLFFEIDHYDDHSVTQERVESCGWIWRVNLLGGGRLVALYDSLSHMPKLRDFINSKGWKAEEGYKGEVRGEENKACEWLTGKPFLPSEALQVDGIREEQITVVTERVFNRYRDLENFTPPLVLFKEHADLPSAFWDCGFLAYRHHVFGIFPKEMAGREKHTAALRRFAEEFDGRRETLAKLLQLTGTRAGVARATGSSRQNILDLPWPEKGFDFCEWEEALLEDLTDGMVEYVQKGERSRLLSQEVRGREMELFQQMFLVMLQGVYPNLRRVRWGAFGGFAYCAFCFGERAELDWPDDSWAREVKQLVYARFGEVLRTVRVVRIYHVNTILLVKPKRLRYWTRSTAIRDADEVFSDLRHQGY
ncbi:MAG: Eco57I restriction-modification methylase domain-containing protein, partial [Kiritimatiellae bacterium]|nr:Eco57I restriction-modification methylase domain-containing protein [Kiritimatiellia bacterium]